MGQHPVLSSGSPIFQQNFPKCPMLGGPWQPLAILDDAGAQKGGRNAVKTRWRSFSTISRLQNMVILC